MKNVWIGLLAVALAACFLWACSLSSQVGGLTGEAAQLKRKYQVLQTLYNQTREEARLAAEQKNARAEAAPAPAAEALSAALKALLEQPLPSPAPLPEETPEAAAETSLFALPDGSRTLPAASPTPSAAPAATPDDAFPPDEMLPLG